MNKFTRAFLLLGLVCLCGLFPTSGRVGTQKPERERVINIVSVPLQPAELLEIKNKHGKVFERGRVEDDDEWMDGLTVSLRNTSDKAIVYAQVDLDFPKAENSSESEEPPLGYHLYYGTRETPDETKSRPSIKPGEVVELSLTEERYGIMKSGLQDLKYGSIKKVKMELHAVIFEDDVMWSVGDLMMRDPDDPDRWIRIKQSRARPPKKKVARRGSASTGDNALGFVFAKTSVAKSFFAPQEEEGCSGCGTRDYTFWTSCADLGVFGGGPGANCRVEESHVSTEDYTPRRRFFEQSIACEQDPGKPATNCSSVPKRRVCTVEACVPFGPEECHFYGWYWNYS